MQEIQQLEQLFRKHHKELCDLAFNIVSDADAAKDVVQEVFIKLWNNRESIEFGDQIKHYLFKATSHTALNYLRSIKKLTRINTEDHVMQIHAASDHHSVYYKEIEQRVREAIEKLPPKCRAIYQLSRHEGLKYQEIADTLGLSIKTVENQMGIALEKMRDHLKPFITLESVIFILAAGLSFWYILLN